MTTNGKLRIRSATWDDAEILWKWANDPTVRSRSYNPDPIPFDSHKEWFSNRLESDATRFYVLMEDDIAVGQIRYDRKDGDAVISFSIDRDHRGKKLGIEILKLTCQTAIEELQCKRITALVIDGNEASRRAFVSADFELEKVENVEGKRSMFFVWQPGD